MRTQNTLNRIHNRINSCILRIILNKVTKEVNFIRKSSIRFHKHIRIKKRSSIMIITVTFMCTLMRFLRVINCHLLFLIKSCMSKDPILDFIQFKHLRSMRSKNKRTIEIRLTIKVSKTNMSNH